MALGGAGTPYLSRLVAYGVDSFTARPALLTEPRGEPLHKYLAWDRGETMAPHFLLLLAACMAAACYTLLVRAMRLTLTILGLWVAMQSISHQPARKMLEECYNLLVK
jgi:hypothetical protein